MSRKPSLRDRNRAVAAAPAAPVMEPQPTQEATTATVRRTAAKKEPAAKAAGESETIRVGITVPPEVLADSRDAYVADLDDLADPALSHSRWVERAARDHLARSIAALHSIEADLPEQALSQPMARAWFFHPETVQSIDEAIARERHEGHPWRSRTAFVVEAMRVAIEAARARRDGSLPQAPGRLPNRPTFRA